MSNVLIRVENVSKQYRLGTIGGGTLRGDLQSLWAKMCGRQDPNIKIDSLNNENNKKFMALDNVSFEVNKGETLGIIGSNGAGKSTLLKLLSRITAPSAGRIYISGRVSSMLEVGTGFHPELTGRENIYLNGAVLGMRRSEVDDKLDRIIEFSECGQFIDTPVKRYSSGMFVRLAFAVAAHLDSDIMLMDEVLAVGDMDFQKKCIDKMLSEASDEKRSIIYVSHNMNTVRRLCGRCIVLDKGKVIYNGETEKAIDIYLNKSVQRQNLYNDFRDKKRPDFLTGRIHFEDLEIADRESCIIKDNEDIKIRIKFKVNDDTDNLSLRFVIHNFNNEPAASALCENIGKYKRGEVVKKLLSLNADCLAPGKYSVMLTAYETAAGFSAEADAVWPAFSFEKTADYVSEWHSAAYGDVRLGNVKIIK